MSNSQEDLPDCAPVHIHVDTLRGG